MIDTNPMLIRHINEQIGQATHRRYQIALDKLDNQSLRELLRLLRDLEDEKRMAHRRGQREIWENPHALALLARRKGGTT